MKTSPGKKQTKFIASVDSGNAHKIEDIAKELNDDGVKINHVSSMLGYLSGKTDSSIEELQSKYKSKGLNIEPDRKVSGS